MLVDNCYIDGNVKNVPYGVHIDDAFGGQFGDITFSNNYFIWFAERAFHINAPNLKGVNINGNIFKTNAVTAVGIESDCTLLNISGNNFIENNQDDLGRGSDIAFASNLNGVVISSNSCNSANSSFGNLRIADGTHDASVSGNVFTQGVNYNFDQDGILWGTNQGATTKVSGTVVTGTDAETVVTHGLPATPDYINVMLRGNPNLRAYVNSFDRTTIGIKLVDDDGNDFAGAGYNIFYTASIGN